MSRPKKNEKLAKKIRHSVDGWNTQWKRNRDYYNRMFQFVYGEQWEDDEQTLLKSMQKPVLTDNKLPTLVNTIIGEQQQNTPMLQVFPLDKCDYQTASVREDIVKDLALNPDSKLAYQVAAKQAFVGGYGAFLVDTEYCHLKSFDQDFALRFFKSATMCYWDKDAEWINKCDGEFAGYYVKVQRSEFRQEHGKDAEKAVFGDVSDDDKREAADWMDDGSDTTDAINPDSGWATNWIDSTSVTIIHDFRRRRVDVEIFKLADGRIVDEFELQEIIERAQEREARLQQEAMEMMQLEYMGMGLDTQDFGNAPEMMEDMQQVEEPQVPPPGIDVGEQELYNNTYIEVVDRKIIRESRITYRKIAGDYVIDETEFKAEMLPLVFVDHDSWVDAKGRQHTRSFLHDVIDTQRYLNYLRTQSAYVLKSSRYDQWLVSSDHVKSPKTQEIWRNPYRIQGALRYDPAPDGSRPQQIAPPELSQSLTQQMSVAMDDLYTSTGLYAARMGQQGNEVSGAAIDARTRQGNSSTFPSFTAINRAITAAGEIINERIPQVFDVERTITIMTASEGVKTVTINKQLDEYGEKIENDLRKGVYQVRLLPGPSYEGQKELALESLRLVLQENPAIFNLVADLYAENLPLANTINIANRLKTLVPPEIIEAGKLGKPLPRQEEEMSPQEQLTMKEIELRERETAIKEQELVLKMKQFELEVATAEKDLELKADKVEAERLESAASLQEQELRYLAETERTQSDAAIAHANNLVKILTHE